MLLGQEVEWVKDGHHLWLELSASELLVTAVQCPHENNPEGSCRRSRYGCVVRWFIQIYGLETNVGVCPPEPYLEVAWALMGDPSDLDMSQLWIIPTKDPIFASFSQPDIIIDG